MNFEWNKSNFSRKFKDAKDASSFMEVWQKVTEEDDNGFERVRKEQQPSDREDAGECDDDDVNGQLNVSKRVSTATHQRS